MALPHWSAGRPSRALRPSSSPCPGRRPRLALIQLPGRGTQVAPLPAAALLVQRDAPGLEVLVRAVEHDVVAHEVRRQQEGDRQEGRHGHQQEQAQFRQPAAVSPPAGPEGGQVQQRAVQQERAGQQDQQHLGHPAGLPGDGLRCPGVAEQAVGHEGQGEGLQGGHGLPPAARAEDQHGQQEGGRRRAHVRQGGQLQAGQQQHEQGRRDGRQQQPGARARARRGQEEGDRASPREAARTRP